ncbi:hypothetical protein NDU88_005522 [Pleurodeles waltl]|uniref:Uncharacterized protein n=1 Tax=Pleurodeles waltl TaxID=8319 RepID=A0AAV7TVP3_PLEWA|nr:hypothetical protein NDU88_005522 [Pleurodeles waltl]
MSKECEKEKHFICPMQGRRRKFDYYMTKEKTEDTRRHSRQVERHSEALLAEHQVKVKMMNLHLIIHPVKRVSSDIDNEEYLLTMSVEKPETYLATIKLRMGDQAVGFIVDSGMLVNDTGTQILAVLCYGSS